MNSAKDQIRRRLHLDVAGPGYMHFPSDRDLGYFQQLLAERLMTKRSVLIPIVYGNYPQAKRMKRWTVVCMPMQLYVVLIIWA